MMKDKHQHFLHYRSKVSKQVSEGWQGLSTITYTGAAQCLHGAKVQEEDEQRKLKKMTIKPKKANLGEEGRLRVTAMMAMNLEKGL